MPFYRYSAFDAKGTQVEGTLQANTPDEALTQLSQRGFQKARILGTATAPSAPAPATQRLTQPTGNQILLNTGQKPKTPAPFPTTGAAKSGAPVPQAIPQRPVVRTKNIGDKDRLFLFAQLSEQLRAGIGPVQAFESIANVTTNSNVKESLNYVAQCANKGIPISEGLAVYPDLYPPHVIGLTRAGEEGGFLPQALKQVSDQAGAAHKFKKFHWFVWLAGLNALLSIPLVWFATRAFLFAYDRAEKAGGENAGGEFINQGFGDALSKYGLYVGIFYAIVIGLYIYFRSDSFRMPRHKLGLSVPALGRRARHESVHMFSWTLSKLAHAGLSPKRSWTLAAESVPNLEMRERLMHAGSRMTHEAKLSDVVFGARLFPDEFAPMVSTGETTGNIAGALEHLADASFTEYEVNTTMAKVRTAGCGCTAMLVTSGIVFIIFAWFWYREFYGKATGGLDMPESVGPY